MNQMFAAKSGPQRDDKQRTLVSMFGGGRKRRKRRSRRDCWRLERTTTSVPST